MTSIEPRETIPQVWTKDFDKKDLGFDFGQMQSGGGIKTFLTSFEFIKNRWNSKSKSTFDQSQPLNPFCRNLLSKLGEWFP